MNTGFDITIQGGEIAGLYATIDFGMNIEGAEAFEASLPKYVRARLYYSFGQSSMTRSYPGFARYQAEQVCTGSRVELDVSLRADGVNGGVNEAGMKRARKFFAVASAAGFEIPNRMSYGNSMAGTFETIVRG